MDGAGDPHDSTNRRFVRLCLCSRWDPHALSEAEKLAAGVNWTDLCASARADGVAPLLYDRLRASRFIPGDALNDLQEAYQETALYAGIMSVELGAVLAALQGAGLPVIVLKGAALGDTLYGNAALRPMTDLDLLLRSQDIAAALDSLQPRGYRTVGAEVRPGLALEFENEIVVRSSGSPPLAVELHWRLLDSPFHQERVDETWFWDTARWAQVAETRVRVLGLEATFLHLSAHYLLHHQASGVRWIHDLAALTAKHGETIDWATVLEKAGTFGLVLSVQVVLQQLADDWGLAPPAEVREAASRLPVSDEEQRAVQWLLSERRPVVQRFWADLSGISDRRRRFAYLMANLFPSADYMERRYGLPTRALVPLAYPYRWLIGMVEFLASRRPASQGEFDKTQSDASMEGLP